MYIEPPFTQNYNEYEREEDRDRWCVKQDRGVCGGRVCKRELTKGAARGERVKKGVGAVAVLAATRLEPSDFF